MIAVIVIMMTVMTMTVVGITVVSVLLIGVPVISRTVIGPALGGHLVTSIVGMLVADVPTSTVHGSSFVLALSQARPDRCARWSVVVRRRKLTCAPRPGKTLR